MDELLESIIYLLQKQDLLHEQEKLHNQKPREEASGKVSFPITSPSGVTSSEEISSEEIRKPDEIHISYTRAEEQFFSGLLPDFLEFRGLYSNHSLLYNFLSAYEGQKQLYMGKSEEDEMKKPQGGVIEEQEAETMTREEAEEAIADVQFAAASGAYGQVDSRTRERLEVYAIFDSSAFQLMDRLGRITNDVNYSKKF